MLVDAFGAHKRVGKPAPAAQLGNVQFLVCGAERASARSARVSRGKSLQPRRPEPQPQHVHKMLVGAAAAAVG
jgi:hypothetical protein